MFSHIWHRNEMPSLVVKQFKLSKNPDFEGVKDYGLNPCSFCWYFGSADTTNKIKDTPFKFFVYDNPFTTEFSLLFRYFSTLPPAFVDSGDELSTFDEI